MLVITDKQTAGVCGERRLAGAGKAKEDGGLAGLRVDVGRAVHGQHVILDREQVVHVGEDRLLDLSGIAGAGDHDAAVGEVKDDGRGGIDAIGLGVAVITRSGEDVDVRLAEARELAYRRANEHLMDEQRLARALADDANLAGVVAIRPGKAANDVELAPVKVTRDARADALVALARNGGVDLTPAHLVMDHRIIDHEAIERRAPRALPRVDDERAVRREHALAVGKGRLDEPRGCKVLVYPGAARNRLFTLEKTPRKSLLHDGCLQYPLPRKARRCCHCLAKPEPLPLALMARDVIGALIPNDMSEKAPLAAGGAHRAVSGIWRLAPGLLGPGEEGCRRSARPPRGWRRSWAGQRGRWYRCCRSAWRSRRWHRRHPGRPSHGQTPHTGHRGSPHPPA